MKLKGKKPEEKGGIKGGKMRATLFTVRVCSCWKRKGRKST